MMPTMRTNATEVRDLGVCPYVVVRRAGVSSDHFDRLVFAETIRLLDALDDLEQRGARHAAEMLSALERTIGDLTIPAVRQELIHLRRDVFNDRVPGRELSAAAEEALSHALSSAERDAWQAWLRNRQTREALRHEASGVFARELASKRHELTRLFRNREFRKGLALASPSLSAALDRYLQRPWDVAASRQRRIERGVLRYYTRAAFKLSPFSSFTRSRLIRLADPPAATSAAAPRGASSRIHRRVTVNRTLIGFVAHAIARHPALADEVPVYRARSMRKEGRTLVFVSHRYGSGGPNRLRVPKEALVRIEETQAIAWLLAYLERAGGMVPRGRLMDAAADRLGDRRGAAALIASLVDVGLLIHKVPLPEDGSPALDALIGFLDALPQPLAGELRSSLRVLASLAERYAGAGPAARREILARISATAAEIRASLGAADTDEWDGLLLYEDCVEHPPIDLPCPEALAAPLEDLQTFVNLYGAMLDGNVAIREAIRHVLATEFGGGPVSFLSFAARYNKRCAAGEALEQMAAASYTVNPLGLPALHALAELRRELSAVLTAHGDIDTIDLRSAAAAHRWPERLAVLGLTGPTRGISCLSTFCQPLATASGSVLVVNRIQPGPCRLLLRVCASLPEGPDAKAVVASVKRWLAGLRDRAVPCELLATFDYNVNVAPRVTDTVINYVGTPHDEGRTVELGELSLSLREGGEIVLTHADGGRDAEIAPVVFGMMAPTFQPPLEFLLLSLGTSEPVLYKPFDPHLWETEEDATTPVLRFPRLTCGACIVRRRGWSVLRTEVPARTETETDADYFARVRRWQRRIGLPDEVFVRARTFKRRLPRSGGRPEQRNRILHKPQYVHFAHYFLVDLLDQIAEQSGSRLYIEEALPDAKDWAGQETARPVEFVIDSVVECPGTSPWVHVSAQTTGAGSAPTTSSHARTI
jgi:hypothetical protein